MKPQFNLSRGQVHFTLDGCDALIHEAIDKTCRIHPVPEEVARLRHKDPWERVRGMGKRFRELGASIALNSTTIIGNSISGGDKGELWQKVMPILFE